jgi:DNA-binding NtrC family response regulator
MAFNTLQINIMRGIEVAYAALHLEEPMKKSEFAIACRSNTHLLITGATGTGKTRLARQVHDQSSRSKGPFVTVNLAAIHEGTLESELFGHERGSFTGADQKRVGRLELAAGGTVFLDEIGELSPKLQARLLEFLQSRTLTPVGGNRTLRVDVRVIAATHRDLGKAVAQGTFREDLYHRLRVISLRLPSLVERSEDFDTILHDCLSEICAAQGRTVLRISEEVAQRLESHDWPGNIRELCNVLEYAVISTEGVEITAADLPSWFGEPSASSEGRAAASEGKILAVAEFSMTYDFHATIARFERDYLDHALRKTGGRINQTAREIGMNKTTLIRRMRALGVSAKVGVE